MPYLGTISSAASYTLEVTCTTQTAITVLNIRRDRISEVEIIVVDPATSAPMSRTVSSNVGRLVFLASTTIGNTAVVKVTQGAQRFEAGINPDGNVQFDVT